MAKKDKAAGKATKTKESEIVMIGVPQLAEKYEVEGKTIRSILRKAGFKAPEADTAPGTFGPRAKYQWQEGSKEYAKVIKALDEAFSDEDEDGEDEAEVEETPKTKKAAKAEPAAKAGKKAKKADPEPEVEADEDGDDEDDDEDEDEE